VFTRKVLIDVFGATPDTIYTKQMEAEPIHRGLYNKYLLSDEGGFEVTERMQRKMAAMVEALPMECSVEIFPFFNRMIYRASAAALFNDAFADDDQMFENFIDFDNMFALAVAGVPDCMRRKGVAGTIHNHK
jgi:hypothetical protein